MYNACTFIKSNTYILLDKIFLTGHGQGPNDLDLSTELPWPDEDPGDLED